MATGPDLRKWRKYAAGVTKYLVVALIHIFVPLAVWRNSLGIADKLSGLPGIQADGGVISGLAALAYVGVFGALLFGGAAVATGADISTTGGDVADGPAAPSTPTMAPTPTPTPSPTPTLESTPTPTPTPSEAARHAELEALEREFREEISIAGNNNTRPYLLATEYRETPDGELELWFVFDEIEWTSDQGAQNMRTQWYNTAVAWANVVGPHEGATPERLAVIGLSEKYNNTYFTIPTSEANAVWHNEMSEDAYLDNWWDRIYGYTDDHGWVQTAYDMVEAEGNTPTDSLAD